MGLTHRRPRRWALHHALVGVLGLLAEGAAAAAGGGAEPLPGGLRTTPSLVPPTGGRLRAGMTLEDVEAIAGREIWWWVDEEQARAGSSVRPTLTGRTSSTGTSYLVAFRDGQFVECVTPDACEASPLGPDVTDPAELARRAVDDGDPWVRTFLVRRTTDQAVLGRVALTDPEPFVRLSAVVALDDQALLARVSTTDAHEDVRLVAVLRLADAPALSKVACEDGSPSVRAAAVKKLIDPGVLARVAVADATPAVREVAVTLLVDPATLTRVATDDADPTVRAAAVGRIDDDQVLAAIVARDPQAAVRRAVMLRSRDQQLLARRALEDPDLSVRLAAAARVTEPALLWEVAETTRDHEVRRAIVVNATDPVVLGRFLGSSTFESVRDDINHRLRALGRPNAFDRQRSIGTVTVRLTSDAVDLPSDWRRGARWDEASLRTETLAVQFLWWAVVGVSRARGAAPAYGAGTTIYDGDFSVVLGLAVPVWRRIMLWQSPEQGFRFGLAPPDLEVLYHFDPRRNWALLTCAVTLPRLRLALGNTAVDLGFGSYRWVRHDDTLGLGFDSGRERSSRGFTTRADVRVDVAF